MAYITVQKGDSFRTAAFNNYSRRQLRNRLGTAIYHLEDLILKDHDGDYYHFGSDFISEADLITIGGKDK